MRPTTLLCMFLYCLSDDVSCPFIWTYWNEMLCMYVCMYVGMKSKFSEYYAFMSYRGEFTDNIGHTTMLEGNLNSVNQYNAFMSFHCEFTLNIRTSLLCWNEISIHLVGISHLCYINVNSIVIWHPLFYVAVKFNPWMGVKHLCHIVMN
jgi:hypothetical protein